MSWADRAGMMEHLEKTRETAAECPEEQTWDIQSVRELLREIPVDCDDDIVAELEKITEHADGPELYPEYEPEPMPEDTFGKVAGIRFGESIADGPDSEVSDEKIHDIMQENESLFEQLLQEVMG